MTQSEYNISAATFYITFGVSPNVCSEGGKIVLNEAAAYDEVMLSFAVVEDGKRAYLAEVKLIPSTSRSPVGRWKQKEMCVSSLC